MILHALESFLYSTIKHASMERVQQYSLKKLNNATSKHFPIVLLINSFRSKLMFLTIIDNIHMGKYDEYIYGYPLFVVTYFSMTHQKRESET